MAQLAAWYNRAAVLVERNNHGHTVIAWLREHSPVQILPGPDRKPGWLTNAVTKTRLYDETARASRLAAADLWPVVFELESRIDLVLVDLTPGTRRTPTDEERKLTRRYYLGYVPTTVVLTSERTPRLLKSERVDAALVRAALLEAK